MRPSPLYAVDGVLGRDCTACTAWKPIAEFYKSAHEKAGITQRCKVCILDRQRADKDTKSRYDCARYQLLRAEAIARSKARRDADPAAKRAYDRVYYRANWQRIQRQNRAWRKANPERSREIARAWRKAHIASHRASGRACAAKRRRAPGHFTRVDIAALYRQQEGRCYYCGVTLDAYEIEHKTPIARGGTHWPANLAVACVPCNRSKGVRTEEEFRASMAPPCPAALTELARPASARASGAGPSAR